MRAPPHILTLILLFLGGCGDSSEVVVAAPGDWANPSSRSLREGMELAQEEVNREGGVDGRPLALEFSQLGRSETTRAVTLAQGWVGRPEVLAAVGHTGSASTAPALPVYRGELPSILPQATGARWGQTPTWSFRLAAPPDLYARTVAELRARRGWTRMAILFDNTPHGRSSAEAVAGLLGDTLLFQPLYTVEEVGSHDPIVEAVLHRNVDAVVLITGERNARAILPLLSGREHTLDVVGDWWPGLLGTPEYRGAYVVMAGFLDARGELRDTAFSRRFVHRFDEPPDPLAAYGYDAVRLLARSIVRSAPSRGAIRRWLADLAQEPVDGVTGPISFDSTGTRIGQSLAVWEVCQDDRLASDGGCQ